MIKCTKFSNRKEWRNSKGQLHRVKGPAIEWNDKTKYWYQNGLLHRTDGYAREDSNGNKYWYQNGLCHRIDGPAVEYYDGYKEWWVEGKQFSEGEFNEKIKLLNDQIKVIIIFIKI